MRRAVLAAVIVVTIAAVMVGATLYVLVLSNTGNAAGFDSTDLTLPSIKYAAAVDNSLPGTVTSIHYSYDEVNLYWEITEDIYARYGGALDLEVENGNSGRLYVYAFGLQWTSTATTYMRNCSVIIDPDERVSLGELIFSAPASGNRDYKIVIKIAISNPLGTQWNDVGELYSSENTVTVLPLGDDRSVEEYLNTRYYYNRINERVSYTAVQQAVDAVKAEQPGEYNILQIAETYTWVKDNIEYLAETSTDYWQTAAETLSLEGGDCEDHAILVASIIGALGGSARVNIIEGHAFPTVFVASNLTGLGQVKAALASYYGVDPSTYRMCYLTDEYGYWLVVDTTGFPYAGGLPAQSAPTSSAGDWTVLSSYIYTIDATGVTTSSGLFDF